MCTLVLIGFVSLILGLIKYMSLAGHYKGKSWSLKFMEIWNDFANYFIAGLIGYYFVVVKWSALIEGAYLNFGDVFLLLVFLFAVFGHLAVVSNNITERVDQFLAGLLSKK